MIPNGKGLIAMRAWHTVSSEETLSALGSHPKQGLTGGEASRRKEKYGPNKLRGKPPRPMALRQSAYNQALCPGSLLVEVGTHGNTLQEALAGARDFARAAGAVFLGLVEKVG